MLIPNGRSHRHEFQLAYVRPTLVNLILHCFPLDPKTTEAGRYWVRVAIPDPTQNTFLKDE